MHFRIAHPDLCRESVKLKLAMITMSSSTTTVSLEARHAFLRRLLKQRVHTQQMVLKELNAHWVASQVRRGIPPPKAAPAPAPAPAPLDPRPRRGGGGDWRAFVHEEQTSDLKRAGELYKRRTAEQIANNTRAGLAAIARHRAGLEGGSFGPKPSAVEANVRRRVDHALAVRAVAQEPSRHDAIDRLLAGSEVDGSGGLAPPLRQARILDRQLKRNEAEEDRADEDLVAIWRETHSAESWRKLLHDLP